MDANEFKELLIRVDTRVGHLCEEVGEIKTVAKEMNGKVGRHGEDIASLKTSRKLFWYLTGGGVFTVLLLKVIGI